MTDKELRNRLNGLFSDIALESEAGAGEAESLLEEAIVDLLGGETEAEPGAAGPTTVGGHSLISAGLERAKQDHGLSQISPARIGPWKAALGRHRTRVLGILLRGVTILGGVLLACLLIGLIWQKSLMWSEFHTLYFAACIVAVVITLIQWMFNFSLARDLQEAEGKHAEAVRTQALFEERADELATANALLQKRTLQLQTATLISQAVVYA